MIIRCLPPVANLFQRLCTPLLGVSISLRVSSLTSPKRKYYASLTFQYIIVHVQMYACTRMYRGVQYVHCMMHTCIMVKMGLRENKKHVKQVKTDIERNQGKFCKQRKHYIFQNRGKIAFWENRKENKKNERMTKKWSSEILVDEMRIIFCEKLG